MRHGLKSVILGMILACAGIFLVPGLVVLAVLSMTGEEKEAVRFKVPGNTEAVVEEPGQYYLWNERETIFNGRSFNRSGALPDGMEIHIQDTSGRKLEFIPDASISSGETGSSRKSIGYVRIENPCRVTIEVTGGDEERIFSFGRSRLWEILGAVGGGIALAFFLALIGVVVGLVGIIRMTKSPPVVSRIPPPLPGAPPSSGTYQRNPGR